MKLKDATCRLCNVPVNMKTRCSNGRCAKCCAKRCQHPANGLWPPSTKHLKERETHRIKLLSLTYENFPEQLRQQVEGFEHVYHQHLRDYDELLPHVLLGDLVRFLTGRVKDGGISDHAVQSALVLLALATRSADQRLKDLVAVSFVEALAGPGTLALKDALRSLVRDKRNA